VNAGRRGISQAAASITALAATVVIVSFVLAAQLPNTIYVQRAGVQAAAEAEELAGVKLSLVALIDGRAIIANDGTSPAVLKKLFTQSGEIVLNPPITIQPGQKVSVLVGNAEALAAELEGTGSLKLVLKEKPGLQIATATRTTECCVTTRYVMTRSTTLYYTSYTPYYVTQTSIAPLQTTYTTTTITHKLTQCISCYYGTTSTRTYIDYYYYTPYVGQVNTRVLTTTVTLTARTGSTTFTSLDTSSTPWTLWYVTQITTMIPSITTVTTTTTATVTLPTYATTTWTTTTISDLRNTLTSTSVVTRPTATTTTTVTVTVTSVVVS